MSTDGDTTPSERLETADRSDDRMGIWPMLGACVACCVPMLVVLGAVSLGAAIAGLVGLAVLAALVAVAVVVRPRVRSKH